MVRCQELVQVLVYWRAICGLVLAQAGGANVQNELKLGRIKMGSGGRFHQARFLDTVAELLPGTCKCL